MGFSLFDSIFQKYNNQYIQENAKNNYLNLDSISNDYQKENCDFITIPIINFKSKVLKDQGTQTFQEKKRGKYKMYNDQFKKDIVSLIQQGFDVHTISTKFEIDIRSLKRWIKCGPERTKGGGKQIKDLQMQIQLRDWWLNQIRITKQKIPLKQVKQMAQKLKQQDYQFTASQGWIQKFIKRFDIYKKIDQILNNDQEEFNNYEFNSISSQDILLDKQNDLDIISNQSKQSFFIYNKDNQEITNQNQYQ